METTGRPGWRGRVLTVVGVVTAVVLVVTVGPPVIDWWHHRLAASRSGADRPAPNSPAVSPRSGPALKFSVLASGQQPSDRPPSWAHLDAQSRKSARLILAATGTRAYLTGSDSSGCEITVDIIAHSSGSGCGGRDAGTLWTAESNTAEPCGIMIILMPDGYSTIHLSPVLRVIANGRNAVMVAGPRRPVQVSISGPDRTPISLGPVGGRTAFPGATGC